MELPSKKVYDVLVDKGIERIWHANSVVTACQFLRAGNLLSRGTVERLGYYQTPQASDRSDRQQGIWFDVFTDSVDIHDRARRPNAYGPVLFEIDASIIRRTYTGKVWVTKLNPTKWAGKRDSARWFQSIRELEEGYVRGRFDQMIVFRHCGGELSLGDYLKRIILDDPDIIAEDPEVDYFSMAYGAVNLALTEGGFDIPVVKRTCRPKCGCVESYGADHAQAARMFVPRVVD